ERSIDECTDARKPGEVRVDEFLGGLWRDADVLRERERRLAVEQRVIDHLRRAAALVLVHAAVGTKHPQRGLVMDVIAAPKGLDERFVFGEMCQYAKLDLRIVRGNQHVTGLGDERAPDLATKLGADRDVLQVWIAAAQSTCGGHRLIEARMHAAGRWIDELGQGV